MSLDSQAPVFIHSLFRAGSTYLFNVFRRAGQGYWCYQEPENEFLRHLDDDAEKLLTMSDDTVRYLRHPGMERPYFWEFYQVRDALSGLFRPSFSYEDFFAGADSALPEDQARYFGALIAHAKGRPVLQFCRSAGRIGALKQAFSGTHIHLWREPRNQWWSCKIGHYFEAAIQLIYRAHGLPAVLDEVRCLCSIAVFRGHDIEAAFDYAQKHPSRSAANYFSFYALWLYAYLEAEKYAEITIGIDRLSADEAFRESILERLAQAGISGLDFSDCAMPRMLFSEEEDHFYSAIERQVQDVFVAHGYNKLQLDEACATHEAALLQGEGGVLLRDAARAREMALRYFDQFCDAEARAAQDEARAVLAETRADQAETRADQAEARAALAEAHVSQLENQLANTERQLAQEKEQLHGMLNSRSWRITVPLRWLAGVARRARQRVEK